MEASIFRRSRAANSMVSGPIWSKFKLVQDMHVNVTANFNKYWITSNQKKRRQFFGRSRAANSIVNGLS